MVTTEVIDDCLVTDENEEIADVVEGEGVGRLETEEETIEEVDDEEGREMGKKDGVLDDFAATESCSWDDWGWTIAETLPSTSWLELEEEEDVDVAELLSFIAET
jgi:hypothetical protein